MNVFEAARQIGALEVAERYANVVPVQSSRRRTVCRCPFPDHDDRHPSCTFKTEGAYSGRFICSCDHRGNSIDFVSQYLNLSPLDAARLICKDFGLRVDDAEQPSVPKQKKAPTSSEKNQAVSNALTAITGYIKYCDWKANDCFRRHDDLISQAFADYYSDESAKWQNVRDRIYSAQDENDLEAVYDLVGMEYFKDLKKIICLLYEYDRMM